MQTKLAPVGIGIANERIKCSEIPSISRHSTLKIMILLIYLYKTYMKYEHIFNRSTIIYNTHIAKLFSTSFINFVHINTHSIDETRQPLYNTTVCKVALASSMCGAAHHSTLHAIKQFCSSSYHIMAYIYF